MTYWKFIDYCAKLSGFWRIFMKKENVPSSILFPLHYPDLSIAIAILDWPSQPGEYRETVILLKIATAWRQQRVLKENHREQPDLTICKPKLRIVEAHTLHDLGIPDNLSLWISYRLVFFPSLVISSVRQWIERTVKMLIFRRFCAARLQYHWQYYVQYL